MGESDVQDRQYDVVVIGGGPAGSTSAGVLAKRGHSVLLLERAEFPRFHIGESMLTYTYALLDRLGLTGRLNATDFPVKTGAEFCDRYGGFARVNFGDQGPGRALTTYQVERERFDAILLDHAAASGVDVAHNARVSRVDLRDGRVVGVTCVRDGEEHSVSARRVIDASGRAGVISKGLLRSRRTAERLRMTAVFRHYHGVDEANNPGVEGDIQIGSHEDGWLWAIPIGTGKLSIGTVTRPEILQRAASVDDVFTEHLPRVPRIRQRVDGDVTFSPTRVESDFTYYSEQVAGPGFFIAGDAGCFVDPIFSAGVYLAMTSGLRAGELTAQLLAGEVSEDDATDRYTRFYKTGYDTYFRLIYAFYEHEFRLGKFLKSTGFQVEPIWVARLFGGDFWSVKNPLARYLRSIEEYRVFAPYEPIYGCPVYPELEAAESEGVFGEPARSRS